MKRDFLIEIGSEEIPAGFIDQALENFHNSIVDKLKSSLIDFEKTYYYSTPRRFIVYATGVAETQKDQVEEIKGPPKKAAFSDLGRPTQAALGFIQTNNATLNDVTIKPTPKGEYLYLTKTVKGASTVTLLPAIVLNAVNAMNFPKTMKWDDSGARFARPVRWILALFGNEVVKIKFGTVESGNVTFSSRKINKSAEISSPASYFDVMKEFQVVTDTKVRANQIITGLNLISEKLGLKPYKDESLIMEVANLTENPEPILCEFNSNFLKVPEKIITSTMIKKQRYFPLYESNGKLTNKFVVFSDGKPGNADEVKYGNQKVIAARLADAEFYYNEDIKTNMGAKAEKLKTVVFQAKLGTMYEKSERIVKLANALYSSLICKVPPQEDYKREKLEKISLCAKLCKADLTSEVVKEFTDLQGYAGMVYAEKEGIAPEIAKGIFEHYKPCFKGDTLAETLEGQCVGIADKLDTIAGCFIIKMIPTGSGDPYALRRAALGIVETIINSGFSFDFKKIIAEALNNYPQKLISEMECNISKTVDEIMNFVKLRFETKLKELGIRYDVINASLYNGIGNIYEDVRKAKSLLKARGTKEFLALVTPFKRALNITKNIEPMAIKPELFSLDSEKCLYETYLKVAGAFETDCSHNDYESAFIKLAEFNGPIDNFFNGVLVMDPDVNLKNNRIALLQAIKNLFFKLVDISQLVIEE